MLDEYMKSLSKIQKLSRKEEAALWQAYKKEGKVSARQKLIEQYQLLVVREAVKYPIQESLVLDLIQEGTVGLMEAAEKYDPAQGVAFSLYAIHRIRGRMNDFLRINQKEIPIDDQEEGGWFQMLESAEEDAFSVADRRMLSHTVSHAMDRLPEREKNVLCHVYLNEKTASETADELSISTAYVHRLEKQGIRRLRGMLSRIMHERK